MIPKPGSSKLRRLGIPTARDRTVQAALKLVLEPIFEADFKPCSYGFRPRRRAQDAIAEIHQFTSRSYEWVLEGDIEACFDMIDHPALMDRVRSRVGDTRVLAVVKSFLHAGVLGEDGIMRDSTTGTPQGGILSPLLANIALSVLDEHFAEAWRAGRGSTYQRTKRRRAGLANYRIVRYADDFVVLVAGTQAHAEALREEVAAVLAPMGLRLSDAKTQVCHIDEGFDFLGFRIQRRLKRGTTRRVVYTYPSKKALASIVGEGPHAHPQVITSDTCGPAASAQPGSPGLVHLLSARRLQGDLRLPRPVHLASGGPVDPETTQPDEMGCPLPPLPPPVATGRGRRGVVPTVMAKVIGGGWSCRFHEARRLSEHLFAVPLQPGECSSHPPLLVQQEQLDPVSVDQRLAEADAELEVILHRRQRSPGPEKAGGGTEDDPSILAVGPQTGREVELGVVGDRRSLDPAVQPEVGKPPLEPSQLGDRERALVGVIAARIEERHHRGLPVKNSENVTRAPSWSSSSTPAGTSARG